ncbi:MAG TPA: multidrug ABC transporter permease [Firmicutes bacterium]|nr:multidrug ABC transporter permease [Bacillota bacterium]
MRNNIRIYLQGAKTALATRMAYRADFFMSMLIMLLVEMTVPMITILIYQNGATFPGWDMYEALLIQGVFLLGKGIAAPFFFGIVWNTIERVQNGTFDLLLIKPKPVLFMAIVTGFDAEDLGKLVGGITLFTIALSRLPAPSLGEWLQFLVLFLLTLTVHFGYGLILASLGIVWIGNYRLYEIFGSITTFGMYPAAIFSKPVQTVITLLLPVAILGSVPATALLGRPSAGTLGAVGVGILFLLFSLGFWRWMLKKYTSVGG